jgi:hypothetical protein
VSDANHLVILESIFATDEDGGQGCGCSISTYALHAVHQDHVCLGGAVARFAWLAIFFAIQPLFGAMR